MLLAPPQKHPVSRTARDAARTLLLGLGFRLLCILTGLTSAAFDRAVLFEIDHVKRSAAGVKLFRLFACAFEPKVFSWLDRPQVGRSEASPVKVVGQRAETLMMDVKLAGEIDSTVSQ
jgi:hypothetical protein